jgi:hypothetical protein
LFSVCLNKSSTFFLTSEFDLFIGISLTLLGTNDDVKDDDNGKRDDDDDNGNDGNKLLLLT